MAFDHLEYARTKLRADWPHKFVWTPNHGVGFGPAHLKGVNHTHILASMLDPGEMPTSYVGGSYRPDTFGGPGKIKIEWDHGFHLPIDTISGEVAQALGIDTPPVV
jgi:hypothetical protein